MTSTLPLGSSPAICWLRPAVMLPVGPNVPVAGSYSSALLSGPLPPPPPPAPPPATSTRPLGSSVAVWKARAPLMLPVGFHVPVAGLYSSALENAVQPKLMQPSPPATSTWPLFSSVAVKSSRAVVMLPVGLNVPVAGLYSSALLVAALPTPPPATSTWPFCSTVAVKVRAARAVVMLPVGLNLPVAGSYSSAVPPIISTWPLCSRMAVWSSRGVVMLPVFAHVPDVAAATAAAGLTASPAPARLAAASDPVTSTALTSGRITTSPGRGNRPESVLAGCGESARGGASGRYLPSS